jgi:threonine synthase
MRQSYLSHLQCGRCKAVFPADQLHNVCPDCGKPLLVRYDLDKAKQTFTREALKGRPANMWRYTEVLPVLDAELRAKNLGEGYTPVLRLDRMGQKLGLNNLYGKDEGLNPTGSFKARGLAMAVMRAVELGAKAVAIPSAGNAGSAMAAYAARLGLPAHVYLPQDIPAPFLAEMQGLGAVVTLIDGLITDCAAYVRAGAAEGRWFDVSTLKEPYRIEGKKTMGYELAEQFNWELPDVILYPTGGGTGLVGMWKAFDEMEKLGWIGSKRPRMISVQASGCAPIVRAYDNGEEFAQPWENAATLADGLRVPAAIGDFLILDAVRTSGGTAIAVEDEAIGTAMMELGRTEGIFAAPEAAATLAALRVLVEQGKVQAEEKVVLFLTGNGLKYYHLVDRFKA